MYQKHRTGRGMYLVWSIFVLLVILSSFSLAQSPEGPSSITHVSNSTAGVRSSVLLNTTGGVITVLQINGTSQNTRWKAYVGNISGSLVLADSAGARVYDWSLGTTFSGEVYATRNDSTIAWTNIACANDTVLVDENDDLNHTNSADNVSATFDDTTHASFVTGTTNFDPNVCPTTNTYQNNVTQDNEFEEVVLWDGQSHNATSSGNGSVVYATIIENNTAGYNNAQFDFQMILPEIGSPTFTSSTAYYFYVELV